MIHPLLRFLFALVLAVLLVPKAAQAAPVRILIAAGGSWGLPTESPLSHPRADATRVGEVFTTFGSVRRDEAIVLLDPPKAALGAALERAQAIARRHRPEEVTVVFYFSGHGDQEAIHLAGEPLLISDLQARLAQIPAALRIAVIDACRTKETLRAKGMTVQPGFNVQLPTSTPASGAVWIYASADGEAAQESDEIGGALFTHFWLAGLRGAADFDSDGRVTLEESFTYGYSQTLFRSGRSSGVLQHPEARLNVSQIAPVVLTEVSGGRAQLEFPRQGDSLYLVYAAGAKTIVAEVYGSADRAVRIALPRGRYIIQKRSGARGAAVEVSLSPGAARVLDASDFRTFSGEVLAQKGAMVFRPLSVAAGGALYHGVYATPGQELFARLEWREPDWAYAFTAFGGRADHWTEYDEVREWYGGAEISLDRTVGLGKPFLFRVGIDLRGERIGQWYRRKDEERLSLAGMSPTWTDQVFAFGGGLHVAARLYLASQLYLDGGARVLGLATKTGHGLEGRLHVGGWLAAGAAF